LQKKIEEFGLQGVVKMTGYRKDLPRLMKFFDVFVLSSFSEGVPLTLLEAMAASKPVVATKVGGNPEVIENGKTGSLVPCGFPERIEVAVMKIYINKNLGPQLAEAGRRRAEEIFSLQKITQAYMDLYNKALGR
jgi:glycosyltransferase involved in cell wall biosynthesis